jgi:hypothetical protein
MQHYKLELQMQAVNEERLDPRIKELFSADLLVAFRHAAIFNWSAEYITKDEQYSIAQQIFTEYAGYELHPAHIYYHVEMYARNKYPKRTLPYLTNAAYKPPKYKIGYLYSDLLLTPSPSETEIKNNVSHLSRSMNRDETLYSIWLNSEQGSIVGEYIPKVETEKSIYEELNDIAKKPLFTKKLDNSQITTKIVIPPRKPLFLKRLPQT